MKKVTKMVLMVLALIIVSALTTVALAEEVVFIPATSYEDHQSISIEDNFTITPNGDASSSSSSSASTKSSKARSSANVQSNSVEGEVIPAIIPEIAAEPEATARSVDMLDLNSLQANLGLGAGNTITIEEVEIPLSSGLEGVTVKIFSDVDAPDNGQQVTLTSFVTGSAGLSYQWQLNVGNGEWLNIMNANGTWYTFNYTEGMSGYSWRLVVDAISA